MMAAADSVREPDHERCGCCGRYLPKGEVAELESTPGVFICVGCAIGATRRAGPTAALRQLRFTKLGSVLRGRAARSTGPWTARAAIPILSSADLDRTASFYAAAGFTETQRYDGYLLLHNGGVELHFSWESNTVPGQCFIHVTDALKLWKLLRDSDTAGLGPVADQDYGLREFVLTDPDGNRVRFGSTVG